MTPSRLACAAVGLTLWLSPLHAQEGPVGIAIVEAPERSSGICVADNLDTAMACARRECAEEADGVRPGDCLRVRWCYPAGWSADIFVQSKSGFHGHDYLCGWPSRDLLMKAVALKCDKDQRDYLLECQAVRIWDSEGNPAPLDP